MTAVSTIEGIAHYGLRVADLARARAFYENLGFKFVVGPVGPEPVAIMAHPSGIELNLVLNASDPDAANILMDVPEKHPGYTHVALLVGDLDVTKRELAELDVKLSGEVTFPGGHMAVFVRDPDRNVIEFHYAPEGSG